MKALYTYFFMLIIYSAMSQTFQAYQLFDKNGEKASAQDLLDAAKQADVILFGELHNNPISHWLQLEVLRELKNNTERSLAVGAEMFEADVQEVIDEYFSGLIKESHFEENSRPWQNYKTDYKPVLEFCREKGIPFIATNIPRRYANLVARNGIDSLKNLSKKAKDWIVPLKKYELDKDLPAYKALLDMMGGIGHSGLNFVHAQAIKDATMAFFIEKNLPKNGLFYHLNGDYHSKDFEGISWYLKKIDKNIKVITVSTIEQSEVNTLETENKGRADFIIAVPRSMTKTY